MSEFWRGALGGSDNRSMYSHHLECIAVDGVASGDLVGQCIQLHPHSSARCMRAEDLYECSRGGNLLETPR